MEDRYSVLKRVFGYDRFRPGQEQIIEALLRGQDVMAVMPTGAGKSVCYQVPALLLPGADAGDQPPDQPDAGPGAGAGGGGGACGLPQQHSLNDRQKELMLRRAREGQYKIIYVAPERLLMPGFAALVHCRPVSMVTVDEAHCISQWGHDFRPSYLQIRAFVEGLAERPVVGAFTATATGQVRGGHRGAAGDCAAPLRLVTGFDRPNLRFETQRLTNSDKPHALVDLLLEAGDVPVIVYCSTVRQVEQTAQTLQGLGFAAAAYHGQLPAELRRRTQEDFLFDRVQVMVATNAFWHGHRQAQCADGGPLQYAPGPGKLLPGGGGGRAGTGNLPAACCCTLPAMCAPPSFFIDKEETEGTGPLVQRQENARLARERLRYMTFYATTPAVPAGPNCCTTLGRRRPSAAATAPAACSPKPSCRAPRACRAHGQGRPHRPPGRRGLARGISSCWPPSTPCARNWPAGISSLPSRSAPTRALRQLCTRRPASMAQLLEIPGINEARAQRYGPALLDAVRRYG